MSTNTSAPTKLPASRLYHALQLSLHAFPLSHQALQLSLHALRLSHHAFPLSHHSASRLSTDTLPCIAPCNHCIRPCNISDVSVVLRQISRTWSVSQHRDEHSSSTMCSCLHHWHQSVLAITSAGKHPQHRHPHRVHVVSGKLGFRTHPSKGSASPGPNDQPRNPRYMTSLIIHCT